MYEVWPVRQAKFLFLEALLLQPHFQNSSHYSHGQKHEIDSPPSLLKISLQISKYRLYNAKDSFPRCPAEWGIRISSPMFFFDSLNIIDTVEACYKFSECLIMDAKEPAQFLFIIRSHFILTILLRRFHRNQISLPLLFELHTSPLHHTG